MHFPQMTAAKVKLFWFACGAGLVFVLAGLSIESIGSAQETSIHSSRHFMDEGPGDREDRLLQGMFSAGLHRAALRYVRSRAALESNPDFVAWWAMREMECLAQQALQDRASAPDYWQQCREVAERYRTERTPDGNQSEDARWPWIVWQSGRCQFLKLQSRLAVVLANPANDMEREEAMELVRWILKEMDSLKSDIKRRQPLAARQSPGSGSEAPPEQLRNLEADIQLLVAETLLVRAQLYPEGSSDRAAALAEVLVTVRDVLKRTGQDWPLRPAMQLAEATAELEMGDTSAIDKLEQILQGSGDRQTRLMSGITAAKAFSKSGDLERASRLIQSLEPLAESQPSLLPNWMLARMSLKVRTIENGEPADREGQLKTLAVESKRFGERFGDYWRMRAEALLLENLSGGEIADSQLALDVLLAEVRQLVSAGQASVAADKLLRARDRQRDAGSGKLAIELASSAAALLRQDDQWQEAIDALEPVATDLPNADGAEAAHVWVIRAYAELYRSQPTEETAKSYQDSLIRHFELWPNSENSSPAEIWLHDWLVNRNRRDILVDVLHQRLEHAATLEQANNLLNQLAEQLLWLGSSQFSKKITKWNDDQSQTAEPLVADATNVLHLAIESLRESDGLSDWSAASVISRRLQIFQDWLSSEESHNIHFPTRALIEIVQWIDRARMGKSIAAKPNIQWNEIPVFARPAIALSLIEALDALEERPRADLLKRLNIPPDWASEARSHVLDGRVNATRQAPHSPLRQIALMRLEGDQNPEEFKLAWDQLVETYARNGPVQLMVAYHFLHQGELEKAHQTAKRIVAFSPAGSMLQLSARWCLLRGQQRMGLKEEVRRAARLTLATQVNLSQRWTERFEQLASL